MAKFQWMLLIAAALSLFPFVFAQNECSECHLDFGDSKLRAPVKEVENSLHSALSCKDCHFFETELDENDSYLKYHKGIPRNLNPTQNVEVCALRCHEKSIPLRHGKSHLVDLSSLNENFPITCTDCHEAHETRNHSDSSSWTYRTNIAETCAGRNGRDCHDSEDVSEQYSILTAFPGYMGSGHGRMQMLGFEKAAVCVDCHAPNTTSHTSIVEKGDPRSPIHPDNREKTCTQEGCHIGQGVKVGRVSMHGRPEFVFMGISIEKVIDIFYSLLISLFVGGAILFIILDLNKKRRGEG
jgi:hypothetical protein